MSFRLACQHQLNCRLRQVRSALSREGELFLEKRGTSSYVIANKIFFCNRFHNLTYEDVNLNPSLERQQERLPPAGLHISPLTHSHPHPIFAPAGSGFLSMELFSFLNPLIPH
jgi:hypothetical protein